MKKAIPALLAAVAAIAMADTPYPIAPATAKANLARIQALRDGAYWKDAPFAVCAVDPLSGIRRTPDLFPTDGDFAGPVRNAAKCDKHDDTYHFYGGVSVTASF